LFEIRTGNGIRRGLKARFGLCPDKVYKYLVARRGRGGDIVVILFTRGLEVCHFSAHY
jgi:hypothetical protein